MTAIFLFSLCRRASIHLVSVAALLAGPGTALSQDADPRFDGLALGRALSLNEVFSADFRGDGQSGNFGTGRIITTNDPALLPEGKTVTPVSPAEAPKINTTLAREIETRPNELFEVIVRFADDVTLPVLPSGRAAPRTAETPEDPARRAVLNRLAEIRGQQQVTALEAMRSDGLDFQVSFQSRLINAVGLAATGATIAQMALRDDVIHIEDTTRQIEARDNNPDNDMDESRAIMRTDPYLGEGVVANRFMAVIDTGFFSDHVLFDEGLESGFIVAWDCVESNSEELCGDNPFTFPDWEPDECGPVADYHGPGVAGIVYGSDALGDAFRGIAPLVAGSDGYGLDFFKAADCTGTFSNDAIELAFEAATIFGNEIINASFGADYTALDIGSCDSDFLSSLADAAYDMGVAVFAATGNEADENAEGAPSPIPVAQNLSSPACAHKVMGIGAYDVEGALGQALGFSSFGPTGDDRTKPDLMGPTNVETVSRTSVNATEPFGGTSAATPHVSAAAMLLKGVMDAAAEAGTDGVDVASVTPGHLYAMLIAMGQHGNVGPDGFDPRAGAGALRLRSCGRMWFGSLEIDEGETAVFDFNLDTPLTAGLTAGIWWPESPNEVHADIDLSMVSATGNTVATSQAVGSVYERVRTPFLSLTPGLWEIRVHGFDVPGGNQRVYLGIWAAGCLPAEFATPPN